MKVSLETERLILREFTEDDAERLLELDSDPAVMRYLLLPGLPNRAAYAEQIRKVYLPYYAANEGHGFWAALDRATEEFLGWFCLRPGLHYRFAAEAELGAGDLEIGYRLRKAAWGKGLATEGSRSLIRKAFADTRTTRVVAMALAANVASWRVMEKIGMRRASEFVLTGFEPRAVKYVLERADFEKQSTEVYGFGQK
jgi:[ribosomal protein S5]-alanine N-acetyltransferase